MLLWCRGLMAAKSVLVCRTYRTCSNSVLSACMTRHFFANFMHAAVKYGQDMRLAQQVGAHRPFRLGFLFSSAGFLFATASVR